MKKYFYLILLILPLFYFSLGSYFHQNIGLYSVTSADPEYIYYMNAVTLANGKLKVGNIDHPGIPLDYLMASSMRVTHFFRANNAPFTEDVLRNSDLYLRVINLEMILLMAALMFLSGYLMLKITPNIWYALVVQFFPFATEIVYGNIGRITTENLIPIPVILLSLLILKVYFRKEDFSSLKNLLGLAIIFAFGLSIKLTLAPLLFIPLIIIVPWKQKLYFCLFVLLIFLLFAIPVTLQLNYFTRWIKGLFLFSGNYGQGDKTIVKTSEFFPNIINLYHVNKHYFIFTFILALSAIAGFFFRKKEIINKQIHRISLSVLVVVLFQVIALGKNYKTPYFIPALILLPLMVILTIEYVKTWIASERLKPVLSLYVVIVIAVLLHVQLPSARGLSIHFDQRNEQRMKAYHFFKTQDRDCIKIIVPGFYGAPVPEYVLMTGYQWAGRHKSFLNPVLAGIFPDSYIFYPWDKTLNYWGNDLNLKDNQKPVYIYLSNIELKEMVFTEMGKYFSENETPQQLFYNDDTKEAIYKLVENNSPSKLEQAQ